MKRMIKVSIIPAAFFSLILWGCGGKSSDEADGDVEVDTAPDEEDTDGDAVEEDVRDEDLPGDPVEDPSDEDAAPDSVDVVEEDVSEDTVEVEEEVSSVCGNGIEDPGEVCDDGDNVTEWCGGGTDCLSDCSLLEANCGNISIDPGEACDDGDTDSMNACTTSCTTNDRNIGAPCTCTGLSCSDRDFHAGTIVGCDNMTVPEGTGGEAACFRSIYDITADYSTFYAEGYCTIMAVECSGSALCALVPTFGYLGTFACPEGYYEHNDERIVMGATITSKSCLKICVSDAECRWNAYDDFWSECGQYLCRPTPADPSVTVCYDGRNF